MTVRRSAPRHTSICTQEGLSALVGRAIVFRSLKGSYFHVPQDFFLKCAFHLPNWRRSSSVSPRRGQVGPRRAERRRQLLPANMDGREAWAWAQGVGAGRGRGGNPKYFFGDSEHTTSTSHNIRFRAVRSDYFLFFRTWSTPQRVMISELNVKALGNLYEWA